MSRDSFPRPLAAGGYFRASSPRPVQPSHCDFERFGPLAPAASIDIKISNVQTRVNLGGLSQPVVGQQTNATDVRLRDGQVTLLGGLLSSNDTLNVAGIPGITNIPILGQFLGATNTKTHQHDELIIALIPFAGDLRRGLRGWQRQLRSCSRLAEVRAISWQVRARGPLRVISLD